ncbi:ubiquitin carboxyl-terminal hydrolase 5/13, partial [Phenoliferia sp. Uapishka_3]
MSIESLRAPTATQAVHREECTQCFDNQDGPLGVDVCLTCYNGGCPTGSVNHHAQQHFQLTGHAFALNVKRSKKAVPKSKRDSNEPPIKKLAIREEPAEHEKYEFVTVPKKYTAEGSEVLPQSEKLDALAAAVLSSMSSAQKSEVKAWEEEIIACSHTTDLVQPQSKKLEPSGLAACAHPGCGLTSNLWLCLICGSLGCGRQQYGGGGGNGHGVEHTTTTGHSVAVKMGTIEPEGTADVYCYACDDAKLDPSLAKHLANFGIEVATQTKTEKSMTELQVEQNLNFDFAMTGEDGKELEPMFGPGLTGMRNLGNSLQSIFSLPTFQTRYLTSFFTHTVNCRNPSPATCFECQMAKVADGLLSGRYSVPREPDEVDAGYAPSPSSSLPTEAKPTIAFQEGIKPSMFKALVGKDHVDFSTMKQQDAGEFLLHLFELVRRSAKSEGEIDPTTIFSFAFEERLQCTGCKGVKYKAADGEFLPLAIVAKEKKNDAMVVEGDEKKVEYLPVELLDCLEQFASPADVEYKCPACDCGAAVKTTRFSTFPEVLIVTPNRFPTVNWVPRKIEVPVILPAKSLSLDKFLGRGMQPDEHALPESEDAPAEVTFDADAMAQLSGMGFPEIRCKRALLGTGNNGNAEAAMEWLFAHMEDADIDDPLPEAGATSGAPAVSEEQIADLVAMGFTPAQGRKALRETGGDVARAIDWVFSHSDDPGEEAGAAVVSAPKTLKGSSSLPANYRLKAFISHKGPSPHSGHYVAHVWTGEEKGWVLFNDEKVVHAESGAQSAELLKQQAHVYFFEKIE